MRPYPPCHFLPRGRAGYMWQKQLRCMPSFAEAFKGLMLDLVVPPLGLLFLVMTWPPLAFLSACQWLLSFFVKENVEGKVVIITGASSGMGEYLSYEYAKHGAKLVLVARRENLLRDIATRCKNFGATDVRIATADVSHEEECKRFIEETVNQLGRLDHLVNNAGITHSFLFEEAADPKALHPVMDVTFWGSVYPTYFALPHLKKFGGRIVVNASTAAWLPHPRMAIYNAAKAALLNFYDTLRVELGSSVGITVATPGMTESEMTLGKFESAEGKEVVDTEQRDVQFGPFPVAYAEEVAKAIFSGAVRGQRYVRVPYWYTISLLYKLFSPELIEWNYRLLYMINPPGSDVPASKLLLDAGAKELMYTSSIKGD